MSMLCVVSHRFGFICTLIAKNASSALREEFGKERYESEECRYAHVDPRLREQYFTFATLREPVSRLLSAYHEVSRRFALNPPASPARAFCLMDDAPPRFATFLDELDDARWDPHLRPQVDYLSAARVDRFIRVEQLQSGIEEVSRAIEMNTRPTLPIRRSRRALEDNARYHVTQDDLDDKALAHIARVYADDVRLYARQFPAARAAGKRA